MDFTKPISAEIDIINHAGAQEFRKYLDAHGIEHVMVRDISMVFIFRCRMTEEQYHKAMEKFPYVLFYQGK